jgi:catechol 2,3-dioxygenase-like lactoylglutathione lyase family enzyme
MFQIAGIDHVAFIVRDIERSAAWYRSVLGMERIYEEVWTGQGDPVALCVPGSSCPVCVALFRPRQGRDPTPPRPGDHFALRVDSANFAQAQEHLRALGVDFTFWNHQISHSIYLREPGNNEVEITTYDLPDDGGR